MKKIYVLPSPHQAITLTDSDSNELIAVIMPKLIEQKRGKFIDISKQVKKAIEEHYAYVESSAKVTHAQELSTDDTFLWEFNVTIEAKTDDDEEIEIRDFTISMITVY